MESKTREIRFANVGRKRQHAVTLFKIGEKDFDLSAAAGLSQTYAEEVSHHYRDECIALLLKNGLELAVGLYVLEGGRVVPFIDGVHRPISAMPLLAAIQERDMQKGQTADYLAALVLHHLALGTQARQQIEWHGYSAKHADAILDNCMAAQQGFFQLYLLQNVQPQFSAGKSRTPEASQARSMKPDYEEKAVTLFKKFRAKAISKERCYVMIVNEFKKRIGRKSPSAHTVKSWLKSRTDLR